MSEENRSCSCRVQVSYLCIYNIYLTHDKNQRNFWSEVKKIEGKSKVRPPHIDGAVNAEDISNVFTTKYKTVYTQFHQQLTR